MDENFPIDDEQGELEQFCYESPPVIMRENDLMIGSVVSCSIFRSNQRSLLHEKLRQKGRRLTRRPPAKSTLLIGALTN